MALLTVPFTSIYLVPHVSGGAIAHVAGGYVAHTFVPPAVVEAFSVASGVLSQMGSAASAIATATTSAATNPLVIGTVVIAAVAVGTYCYFHGIPAPIEAALAKAGLGTATKHGFMITVPKLAVALILLGGAGYLAYRFYKSRTAERVSRLVGGASEQQTPVQAQGVVHAAFGDRVWAQFGSALWSSANELGRKSKDMASRSFLSGAARAEWIASQAKLLSSQASDSLSKAAAAAAALASSAAEAGVTGAQSSSDVLIEGGRLTGRWLSRIGARLRRKPKPA